MRARYISSILGGMLLIGITLPVEAQSNELIFTGHGLFHSCDEAVNFRNSVLLKEFDRLAMGYSENVARIDRAIKEMEENIKEAESLYANADHQMRKEITINLSRLVALKLLSKVAIESIPKEVRDRASKAELEALELVITRSAEHLELVRKVASGEKVQPLDISTPTLNLAASALSKFTPIGKIVVEVAAVSEAAIYPYLEWAPVKRYASQDEKSLILALRHIESLHPKVQIRELNLTKTKIDTHCGQKSALPIDRGIASSIESESTATPSKQSFGTLGETSDNDIVDDMIDAVESAVEGATRKRHAKNVQCSVDATKCLIESRRQEDETDEQIIERMKRMRERLGMKPETANNDEECRGSIDCISFDSDW